MKTKLAKLIDVKSFITFGIVGSIIVLGLRGHLAPEKIYELGLIIIGFYFGVKQGNKQEEKQKEGE